MLVPRHSPGGSPVVADVSIIIVSAAVVSAAVVSAVVVSAAVVVLSAAVGSVLAVVLSSPTVVGPVSSPGQPVSGSNKPMPSPIIEIVSIFI
jgi:hypothetical protein